jgi:6-phosphofructokinase 1
MTHPPSDFMVADLREAPCLPLARHPFIDADERVLYRDDLDELRGYLQAGIEPPSFELAGPREWIFFDPRTLKCGIVTCGGLCPGLNDAVRAIVIGLREKHGVQDVYGFQFGYEGLVEKFGHKPVQLTSLRVGGSTSSAARCSVAAGRRDGGYVAAAWYRAAVRHRQRRHFERRARDR